MKKDLSELRKNKLLRYLIVGCLGFLIEVIIIFVALRLHANSKVAISLGFWIGLAITFLLQKVLAFKSRDFSLFTLSTQSIMYGALVLWNYFFTLICLHFLENVVSIYIIRAASMLVIICWNFALYKIIFKKNTYGQN